MVQKWHYHRRDTNAERQSSSSRGNSVDVDFYQQHSTRFRNQPKQSGRQQVSPTARNNSNNQRSSATTTSRALPKVLSHLGGRGRVVRASFAKNGEGSGRGGGGPERWSSQTNGRSSVAREQKRSFGKKDVSYSKGTTRVGPSRDFRERRSDDDGNGFRQWQASPQRTVLPPDGSGNFDKNNGKGNWNRGDGKERPRQTSNARLSRISGGYNENWKEKKRERQAGNGGFLLHKRDRRQSPTNHSGLIRRDKGRWKDVEGSRYFRRNSAPSKDGPEQDQHKQSTNVQNSEGERSNRVARGENGQRHIENELSHRRVRNDRDRDQHQREHQVNSSNTQTSSYLTQDAKRRQFAAELSQNGNDERSKKQRREVVQVKRSYPPDQIDAYVACHPGLEMFLCQELEALGIAHKVKGYGATLLSPSIDDLRHCHLYLGTASNVFLRCGEPFSARALGELGRKVEIMPWRRILGVKTDAIPRFHIKVTSAKSRLLHSTAIRDRVLVGIYKSLGHQDFEDQKLANNAAADCDQSIRLTVQFFRDNAQISIDTSATPIHQRGYRLETAKAPLREDLAFAFLYGAGWMPAYTLSCNEESKPDTTAYTSFLDPFCGSGTLAIEAAAMAAGLPPGRLRRAPMKGTSLYDPIKWENLVANALQKSATIDASKILIRASDRDKGAVRSTKSNAERAGVLSLITAEDCAFTANSWLDEPSNAPKNMLLAANLPFGRRISAPSKHKNYLKHPLLPLYQSLANHVNALSDSGCQFGTVLLTDDCELLRIGGFRDKFDATLSTKHGGIPVSGMFMKTAKLANGSGVM